jgi:hypothetical protein
MFAGRLNRLDERLQWTNPAAICSSTCLTRTAADGELCVQFYTDRFSLKNEFTDSRRYLLVRQQGVTSSPLVTVNGQDWNCTRNAGALEIRMCLAPGETADIKLAPMALEPWGADFPQGAPYRVRVWVRRMLSEFRDNHVDTSPVLSKLLAVFRSLRNRRDRRALVPIASSLGDS